MKSINSFREFVHVRNKEIREIVRGINKAQNTKAIREFIRIRNRKATEVVRRLNKFE